MRDEPDHAVAAGIIVTELVLNALKHAYPDGKGPVRLSLRAGGHARAYLTLEDDGAEWRYDDTHQGTRVTLRFDRSASAPPAA